MHTNITTSFWGWVVWTKLEWQNSKGSFALGLFENLCTSFPPALRDCWVLHTTKTKMHNLHWAAHNHFETKHNNRGKWERIWVVNRRKRCQKKKKRDYLLILEGTGNIRETWGSSRIRSLVREGMDLQHFILHHILLCACDGERLWTRSGLEVQTNAGFFWTYLCLSAAMAV